MRGVLALVVGDRNAGSFFDFGQRGVVTSFLPLLILMGLQIVASMALGLPTPGGFARSIIETVVAYGAIMGGTGLLLRALSRQDVLWPFLVVFNWSNVGLTVLLVISMLTGFTPALFLLVVVAMIISINIGRLIMTLRPVQIALLIGVQVVGLFAALLLVSFLFPLTPEQLAELMAASSLQP